jgi:hypothetical protein
MLFYACMVFVLLLVCGSFCAGVISSLMVRLRAESFQAMTTVLPAQTPNANLYLLIRGSADEMSGDLVQRSISSSNCFGDKYAPASHMICAAYVLCDHACVVCYRDD